MSCDLFSLVIWTGCIQVHGYWGGWRSGLPLYSAETGFVWYDPVRKRYLRGVIGMFVHGIASWKFLWDYTERRLQGQKHMSTLLLLSRQIWRWPVLRSCFGLIYIASIYWCIFHNSDGCAVLTVFLALLMSKWCSCYGAGGTEKDCWLQNVFSGNSLQDEFFLGFLPLCIAPNKMCPENIDRGLWFSVTFCYVSCAPESD